MIAPPDCSFHSQTCSRNASRPMSARLMPGCRGCAQPPSALRFRHGRCRRPTTHPCRAFARAGQHVLQRLSSACPICSEPVTLGGGMTIVHGVASGRSGRNRASSSQCAYQRSSIARGLEILGKLAHVARRFSDAALQHQPEQLQFAARDSAISRASRARRPSAADARRATA